MYRTELKDVITEYNIKYWQENYSSLLKLGNSEDSESLDEVKLILSEFSVDKAKRNAEELMGYLDSVLENLLIDAERYQILPKEMREFLEADPDSMFTFARRLHTAIQAEIQMMKIIKLLDKTQQNSVQRDCLNCSFCLTLNCIRKIVQEN